jgi:hypothetical protein
VRLKLPRVCHCDLAAKVRGVRGRFGGAAAPASTSSNQLTSSEAAGKGLPYRSSIHRSEALIEPLLAALTAGGQWRCGALQRLCGQSISPEVRRTVSQSVYQGRPLKAGSSLRCRCPGSRPQPLPLQLRVGSAFAVCLSGSWGQFQGILNCSSAARLQPKKCC